MMIDDEALNEIARGIFVSPVGGLSRMTIAHQIAARIFTVQEAQERRRFIELSLRGKVHDVRPANEVQARSEATVSGQQDQMDGGSI